MHFVDRYFDKHDSSADLYPLLDLYRSEVIEPLGLGTYDKYSAEGEYIDRENEKNGIITSDDPPNKHKSWYKYTKDQKILIAKMHAREKATRHKDLLSRGAVFPRLRDTGYVR